MNCQMLMLMVCVALFAASAQAGLAADVLRSAETRAAIEHRFTAEEEAVLEEVQRGCFLYFWNEVGTPAKLAKDRRKAPVASVAAVGFQLSSLPIGVERGWITREQGRRRAHTVLSALLAREDNKHLGIYLHFPDYDTAGVSRTGYEVLASTVDSALLLAGAIPAAEYFGGEVKTQVNRMLSEANWKAFATGPGGLVSMGWRPKDPHNMAGAGEFHAAHWNVASDEERLVYFMAVGAPRPAHAIEPEAYYRLKRVTKRHEGMPPFVVSYQGTLFHYFFSHCWIDYRALGADDPARLGVDAIRVDWFENSRRAVLTHRQRCSAQAPRFKTLAVDRWGLSACAGRDGYLVPEVQPNLIDRDTWYAGTVAPYAAATAIMFTPRESMAAIRAFRALEDAQGKPFAWRDPGAGGYGFVDCFNLDQGFASDDCVGIDAGPMLLGIENARTGLIWQLFMSHEMVRENVARLRLER